MSAFWGQLAGVTTVLLLLLFIGIWIWAWRPRNKKSFDKMSKIPMQDEDLPADDEETKQ